LVLALVSWLVLRSFRRPYAIVGWLWYVGTLVPVIGLVQVGNQAFADRYTYVPLIGIFVAIAWGGCEALRALAARAPRAARTVGPAVALAVVAACAGLTAKQASIWRDSILLFEHTLNVAPNNSIIHVAVAASYAERRRFEDSVRHARRALEIRPDYVEAYVNLGNAWIADGDPAAAAQEYRRALEIDPERPDVLYNLGNALTRLGEMQDAIAAYARAIELDASDPRFWHNLGKAYSDAGRVDEAVRHYERALELDPNMAVSHYMLGRLLSDQQRHADAEQHYRRAVEIDPSHTKARYYLERAVAAQKAR